MSESTKKRPIKIVVSKSRNNPPITIVVPDESAEKNSHTCDKCSMLFKSEEQLQDHISCHPKDRPHTCDQCGRRFTMEGYLKRHIRGEHAPKKFACDYEGCTKSYVREKHLERHFLAHSNYMPFKCEECGKRFKLQHHLQEHNRVHKIKAPFQPESKVGLRKRKKHDTESSDEEETAFEKNVRVWTCSICNVHFKRNFSLKRHYSSHFERHFPCAVCDPIVDFKTVVEREEHYATHHEGKPYTCHFCNRSFKTKHKYTNHIKKHIWSEWLV